MDGIVDLGRQAMMITLTLASPLLVVGLLVGLLVGIVQAVTQVHDPTISLVPRIMATLITLIVSLPWLIGKLVEFSESVLQQPILFLGVGSP